jgi:hypothetical protein
VLVYDSRIAILAHHFITEFEAWVQAMARGDETDGLTVKKAATEFYLAQVHWQRKEKNRDDMCGILLIN